MTKPRISRQRYEAGLSRETRHQISLLFDALYCTKCDATFIVIQRPNDRPLYILSAPRRAQPSISFYCAIFLLCFIFLVSLLADSFVTTKQQQNSVSNITV